MEKTERDTRKVYYLIVSLVLSIGLFAMLGARGEAQEPSLKVQADILMNSGVELYNSDDFQSALETFEQAQTLYHLAEAPVDEANALAAIGQTTTVLGRYTDALETFQQAQTLYREFEELEQEAEVSSAIAKLYARSGEYLRSLHIFQEVLRIEQALGERKSEGRTWNNIGAVYLNQGWHEDALQAFTEALTIAQEPDIDDLEGQGTALSNFGTVYRVQNFFLEALSAYQQAFDIKCTVDDTSGQAAILLGIGDVYLDMGDNACSDGNDKLDDQHYSDALGNYQEALTLYLELNNRLGEATARMNIGKVSFRQLQYSEAISQLTESLAIYREEGDSSGELEILAQLLEVYDETNDRAAEAVAYTDEGEAFYSQGQYDEAESSLKRAVLLYQYFVDEPEEEARALVLRGKTAIQREDYEDAGNYLDQALFILGDGVEQNLKAHILTHLGEAYLLQEQYLEASDVLEQALLIHQRNNNREDEAQTLMFQGEVLFQQKLYAEALEKFTHALPIQQEIGTRNGEARTYTGLGEVYFQQAEYDNALAAFDNALSAYQNAANREGEGMAFEYIGHALNALGRSDDALDAYQNALEIYRVTSNLSAERDVLQQILIIQETNNTPEEKARTLIDLGSVFLGDEDYDEALNVFEEALTIYTDEANQTGIAESLLHIGIVHSRQAQYSTASNVFSQSLAIYQNAGDRSGEASVLLNIGHMYFYQGRYSSAEGYYQQALPLYQELQDYSGEGTALSSLGDVYNALGDYPTATEYYRLATLAFARVDDHYNMVLALMSLGDVYTAQGLYWDALEAYRRALGIMHDTGAFMFTYSLVETEEVIVQAIDSLQPSLVDTQTNGATRLDSAKNLVLTDLPEQFDNIDNSDSLKTSNAQSIEDVVERDSETEDMLEILEEALDQKREENDYTAQEEIVELIEELDPEYVQRTVSWLDDDNRWSDEEFGSSPPSTSSPENSPQPKSKTREQMASARDTEAEFSGSKTPRPRAATAIEAGFDDQNEIESSTSENGPRSMKKRRGRPTPTTRAQESSAELQRKAETFNDIGLVHLRQGAFHKAGSYFLSAQRIQNASGDEQGKALTLSNRATLRYMLGQFEEAGELYLEALDLMRKFQDIDGETQVMNQLALLYYRRGQYEETEQNLSLAERYYAEALKRFQEALALSHGLEEHAIQGTLLNNRALLYYQLMLFYRKAGYAATETAEAQGCYQHAFRMYQLALKSYQESLEIIREFGGRAGESATLHNFGKLYAVLELDSEALDYFWQALELEQATSNYIDWARTLSDIGYIYERRGKRIIGDLRDSSDLTGFKNLSGLARSWKTFTQGAFAMQQALGFYQQAIDIQESLRTKARLEEFKISFAEESANVYQQSVLLLMAMNSPELAFNMTERARARAFLDTVGTVRPDMLKGLPTRTAERVPALRKEIQRVYRALRHEQEQPLFVDNREKIDRLQADLDHLEAQYDELLMEMKLTHPKYASLLSVDPLMLQEVQSVLGAEESLMSYFVTPQKLLTFVLKQHSFNSVELSLNADELYQEIAGLRKSDDPQEPQREGLSRLYEWLIEPVAGCLDGSRLKIAPHGLLHYLPFAALYDGERYLNDDYQLSTIPSGSVLQFLPEETQGESATAFVIGNEGYPPLKYAEKEAGAIADLYEEHALVGDAATIAAFRNAAGKAGIIHFAGHAGLDRRTPVASGLLLDDGYLTIRDMYALDLSRSELVVLSACNTNIGPQSRGDDMIALNRAFLSAGASTVVASLWSVNDEAASQLMLAFHENLQQGVNTAEALRQAQIKTRRDFPNPKYWAAFVLTGAVGK